MKPVVESGMSAARIPEFNGFGPPPPGPLDTLVSYVAGINATVVRPRTMSARTVLELIKIEWKKRDTEDIRTAIAKGDLDSAAWFKCRLPGVTWAGEFSRRAKHALIRRSGLICVDVDDLGARLLEVRAAVFLDRHTVAAFVSPSGTGLKILYFIDVGRPHEDGFRAAAHYVRETFHVEADETGKDVSRLCFIPADAEIYVNEWAEPLPYPPGLAMRSDGPARNSAGRPRVFTKPSCLPGTARRGVKKAKQLVTIPTVAKCLFPYWKPSNSCCSPFRPDKSPSFSVYAEGQRWHDFGTGEDGNVVDFMARACDISHAEAAQSIIEGVDLGILSRNEGQS